MTTETTRDLPLFSFMTREPIRFGGSSYDAKVDEVRLTGLLARVFEVMSDSKWRTLREIQDAICANSSDASISARLRDLRKKAFGGHTVNRRRRGEASHGLFEYQLQIRI